MADVIHTGTENVFYGLVAKKLGKETLERHEFDAVFAARFNAVLNFELNGRTQCPYESACIVAAWDLTMDMMENNGILEG